MGLDMYLSAEKYLSKHSVSDKTEQAMTDAVMRAAGLSADMLSKDSPGVTIDVTVGYWRKANAIHGWFVNNCQDGKDECQKSYVPRADLKALRDACQEVLADNTLAEELLPVQQGFFFGSYEYDEWYFDDLRHTVEVIDKCLEMNGVTFNYQASW